MVILCRKRKDKGTSQTKLQLRPNLTYCLPFSPLIEKESELEAELRSEKISRSRSKGELQTAAEPTNQCDQIGLFFASLGNFWRSSLPYFLAEFLSSYSLNLMA